MKTIVTISPSQITGTVAAPGSKSMAHRLLICAALAEGESHITGVPDGDDVRATLDCLRALGAVCKREGDAVSVRGTDIFCVPSGTLLECRESASTLRFLSPLCLLGGETVTLHGSESLLRRPLSVYETLCEEQRLAFERGTEHLRLRGSLRSGELTIPGNVSSQFVSGLLFALPLLPENSVLHLLSPVESRPYIDMTRAAMAEFGVAARWCGDHTLSIPGGQRYQRHDAHVEGDWSNAAFFFAMGAAVEGLDSDSLQGDRCCDAYLARLKEGFAELDLSDCPDLGPVLFAFAASHFGGRFFGTRRLHNKESDRVFAMAQELEKFGVAVTEEKDTVTVSAGVRVPIQPLDGHGDHRVVMALATLCVLTGGTIFGAEAVNKSFPDFFGRLRALGVDAREEPAANDA